MRLATAVVLTVSMFNVFAFSTPAAAQLADECTNSWIGGPTAGVEFLEGWPWAEGVAPGADAVVCVPEGELHLSGVEATIGRIILGDDASVVLEASTLTLTADANLDRITVDTDSRLAIEAGAMIPAEGALVAAGAVSVSHTGHLANSGELTLLDGGSLLLDGGSARNDGTLEVDAPTLGVDVAGAALDTPGSVHVRAGTLRWTTAPLQAADRTWRAEKLIVDAGARVHGLPALPRVPERLAAPTAKVARLTTQLFNPFVPIDPFAPIGPGIGLSPMVMTFGVNVTEGSSGSMVGQVASIEFYNPDFSSVPITWSAFSSSATVCGSVVPCDAQVVSGSAILPPGTSFVSVPYSVFGDLVDEPDEFFSIGFSSGGAFSFGAVTVTIVDDDAALTVLTASGPASATEGADAVVTVTAPAALATSVSIPITLRSTTASIGSGPADDVDPSLVPASLVIPAFSTSASFTLRFPDDSVPDPGKSVDVVFGTPTGATVTPGSLTIGIDDNDPPAMQFSAAAAAAPLSEGGAAPVTVTVSPTSVGGTGTVHLPVTIVNGSATAGSDFVVRLSPDPAAPPVASGDLLDVPAAGGSIVLYVVALPDGVYEGPETFVLKVGRAGVAGEQSSTTITIPDDDPVPTVSVSGPSTVNEHDGTVSSALRLSGPAAMALQFDVHVGPGAAPAATAGSDFVEQTARLTVPAGALVSNSVVWQVIDDSDFLEPDLENLAIDVTPASNPLAAAAGSVAIADDDASQMSVVFTSSEVTEGSSVDVTVGIVPQHVEPSGIKRLPIHVESGTGDATTDLQIRQVFANGAVSPPISPAGDLIDVPTEGGDVVLRITGTDDAEFELPEDVTLVIGRAFVPLEQGRQPVTVLDNEPRPGVTVQVLDPHPQGFPEFHGSVGMQIVLDAPAPLDLPFHVFDHLAVNFSASVGDDFVALDSTVTVPKGATRSAPFSISIIDDTDVIETTERVLVVAELASFPPSSAEFHILNDDVPATVQFDRPSALPVPIGGSTPLLSTPINDPSREFAAGMLGPSRFALPMVPVSVTEGTGTDVRLELPVTRRSGDVDKDLTFEVTAHTLELGLSEFTVETPTVTIPAKHYAATVVLTIHSDTEAESPERVEILIQSPDVAAFGLGDDVAMITVLDDDYLPVTPAIDTSTVAEGGFVTVSATIPSPVAQDVLVPVSYVSGTATVGAVDGAVGVDVDTTRMPPSLLIPAGSTSGSFRLLVDEDPDAEAPETFDVAFGAPNLGRLADGATARFTLTITDNDPPALRLSIAGQIVFEGKTAVVTLVATPVDPLASAAFGMVSLPVRIEGDQYALPRVQLLDLETGADLAPGGMVQVPASGGTVRMLLVLRDDTTYAGVQLVDVVAGRAGTPGERTLGTMTLGENEPFPKATIQSASPYLESAGLVPVHVQMSGVAVMPITWHVVARGGTAEAGEDYVPFERDIVVPAGSTSSASVPFGILDNSATLDAPRELVGFELTAPGLPLGTGGLEIIDDDLVLAKFARGPDVRPNEPVRATVTETDVGTVEVRLPIRLVGPTPAAPITVDVVVDSLSADASDFTFGPAPLVFAAGETLKDLVITVLPDDIPEIDDVLLVAIQSPDATNLTNGPDMAVVTILNDDVRTVARFERVAEDPPNVVLDRTVTEGASLPLRINLTGQPITTPLTVGVNLFGQFEVFPGELFGSTPDDYSVVVDGVRYHQGDLIEVVFQPGDTSKTLNIELVADGVTEGWEGVLVVIDSDATVADAPGFGATYDTARVLFFDEAAPAPSAGEVLLESIIKGWNQLVDAVTGWLRQFNLAPSAAPPVAQPLLADYFDVRNDRPGMGLPRLPSLSSLPSLPPLPDAASAVAEACRMLAPLGVVVQSSEGGACGGAASSTGDLIDFRFDVHLPELAKAAGLNLAELGPDALSALAGLGSSLGLTNTGQMTGAFDLVLNAGIDRSGAFVLPTTRFALSVRADLGVAGSANIAGAPVDVTGRASALFAVRLSPAPGAGRDLTRPFNLSVTGDGSMSLDVATGPLQLTWGQQWRSTATGKQADPPSLVGVFEQSGLDVDTGPARFAVTGQRIGDLWRLSTSIDPLQNFFLGGFAVHALQLGADIGPTTLSGSGGLRLDLPLPGGTRFVDTSISFGRSSFVVDGISSVPVLGFGTPEIVRFVNPFAHAHFEVNGGAAIAGQVAVGADSALLLPASGVGSASGLVGTLSSSGDLVVTADSATVRVLNGAANASATGARLQFGPSAGSTIFSATTASATAPTLDGLRLTLHDLTVSATGAVGASAVDVDSTGLAASIGLGGLLPFDVTSVGLDFPDRSNLDRFSMAVTGRFNFAAIGDLGGVTPRLGLGGAVVTPSSPADQNRFTFSIDVASLARGQLRPLDVGPVTVGFDGLHAGDLTVGGQVSLGGYAGGEFVPSVAGDLLIDGPAGSVLDSATVRLAGTFSSTPVVEARVSGSATFSGAIGPLVLDGLTVDASMVVRSGSAGVEIVPRLDRMRATSLAAAFGDLMTLRATDVTLDPTPVVGGNLVSLGSGGVLFNSSALAGFGGTFHNVAIGRDFVPRLLPGFGIDVTLPSNLDLGLPDFLPFTFTSAGITLPSLATIPPGGLAVGPSVLSGMRLRVSGGLRSTPQWPIAAAVEGLEVDLDKLIRGEFPITNLDGVSMGVEPFSLPGDVMVGGGLMLGTVDVAGTTVFYGRIRGELQVAGIGGGADLVVTQYGPVLLKVTAPLGVPLGPTGLVLADVTGAARFGGSGVPVPPRGNPEALLTALTLPTEVTIDAAAIAAAVAPVVTAGRSLWSQGFALSLRGRVVAPATPGLVDGSLTLGVNFGLPVGPNDPSGLQLVGVGDLKTFGMSIGRTGVLIDLADPLAPSYDFAFASPPPLSPLALIMPGRAIVGMQLRTDGVVLGTVQGLRALLLGLADGVVGTAEQFFDGTLDHLVSQLAQRPTDPLAVLLLDLDGNGVVAGAEGARTIDRTFLTDRLLGRNGLPALLPARVDRATLAAAGRAATAVMAQVFITADALLTDPQGTFAGLLPAGAVAAAFDSLVATFRSATTAGLAAFGELFDPSITISGALQPTFLGLPLGDPTVGGRLNIDRRGLSLDFEGSMIELAKAAIASSVPLAQQVTSTGLTLLSLGLSDRVSIGARLPFGGLVDSLLGGGAPPTFQPLDPNWAVTIGGSINVFGFPAAEVNGVAFLPGQRSYLESKVQKVYELAPNTPLDPTRIPVSSSQRFESLVQYGGVLVTSVVRVPRLLTDPAAQLQGVPAPPADPAQYPAWLEQVAGVLGQPDTPVRMQYFLPGLTGVTDAASAQSWVSAAYAEGVWSGRLLGVDLGRAEIGVSVRGLEVTGNLPLLGVRGTAVLNTGVLASGTRLPSAGIDVSIDSSAVGRALTQLGLPAGLPVSAGASGRFRLFTPGVDPTSADPLLRFGGMHIDTRLDLPGLVSGAQFAIDVVGRAGGFDLHGSAKVSRVGPLAGVSLSNVDLGLDVVGGVATVSVQGDASVFGATARATGTLSSDLTGSLSLRLTSGSMSLAGVSFAAAATLTNTRVAGALRTSLSASGSATLPSWLVTSTGRATLTAAACVDSAANVEVAIGVPAMSFGPGGLVTVGRAAGTAALPTGPAACALPADAPAQSATGPLLRLRSSGLSATAVISGSIDFAGAGSVAGMSVSGALDATTGTGSLAVAFAAGSLNLGGFSLRGSATARFSALRAFSMSLNGSLTIPGVVTDAVASGSADERGIVSLGIAATGLTLPPLTVNSATASLQRTGSVYTLSVGADVTAAGIGKVAVSGELDSAGFGRLGLSLTALGFGGATITSGSFAFVRSRTGTSLSASGRIAMFGATLEVPSAEVTVLPNGGGLSGSLVVRAVGNAPLVLGGWSIGGTLRLSFNNLTSRVVIDNGTLSIPGWGAVSVTADIPVPVVDGAFFALQLPAGGLRLGGAASPFFATGGFSLSFKGGVGELSVTRPSLEWRTGATVIAGFSGPSLVIRTDGSFSASLAGFSASLGGFSFTVPSLSMAVDPSGLNARISLGAGSLTVPGLPVFTTPAISVGTASTFSVPLVANSLDLGLVRFRGSLFFERNGGVFHLRMTGPTAGSGPELSVAGLLTMQGPTFDLATDGTFSFDLDVPSFGAPGFPITNASLHLARTGPLLNDVHGSFRGGVLHLPFGDPVTLPELVFDGDTRFDHTFTIPGWNVGTALQFSGASVRFRQLSTGVVQFDVLNTPSASVLGGSGLTLNDLFVDSAGAFRGSVTGRVSVFGHRLASATFDLARSGGVVTMSLPASRAASLNLGFLNASVSGRVSSDGGFDFRGDAAAGVSFPMFAANGSVSVVISSVDGVTGSFNGSVCFLGACAATGASLRSDGRLKGFLRIELGGGPPPEIDIDWRVYLASGALLIDANRDGDWADIGDVWIGDPTDADVTPPSMTQPANIDVQANVPKGGRVAVYYTSPSAYDGTVALPVVCTPASGSDFAIGTTTVTCSATDSGGNTRTRTFTVTVVNTAAAPAAATYTIAATAGLAAAGFAPSSLVGVWVHSTPVFLGMFPVDSRGRVIGSVRLPADLPAGEHTLVLEGVAPGGAARQVVQPIVLSAPEPPAPPTTEPGGGVLPGTGGVKGWPDEPSVAVMLLLVGVALVAVARPRRIS